jgi:membrane protease YdiL (CAAX protease family)
MSFAVSRNEISPLRRQSRAPIAEELVFRGMLYHVIARTSMGHIGAILVPAVMFTVFHLEHGLRGLLFIMVSGLS